MKNEELINDVLFFDFTKEKDIRDILAEKKLDISLKQLLLLIAKNWIDVDVSTLQKYFKNGDKVKNSPKNSIYGKLPFEVIVALYELLESGYLKLSRRIREVDVLCYPSDDDIMFPSLHEDKSIHFFGTTVNSGTIFPLISFIPRTGAEN